jgi:hypothetical protein
VYFDDSYAGTTPVTIPVSSTGTPDHTIRVEKSGYQPWEETHYGNPFEGETIHINANLVYIEPTTPIGGGKGYYSITSSPSGATVYIDGTYKGTTPVTVTVPSTGTPGHTIRISLSGYQTWSNSYSGNPAEGETIYVSAYLQPVQTYGSIYVDSSPSQATATLDGANSQTTPCTFHDVYPGSHTVRVTKSGYQTWSSTVSVSAGRTTAVSASLSQVSPGTGVRSMRYPPPRERLSTSMRDIMAQPHRSQAVSRSGTTRSGSRFQGSRTGPGASMLRTERPRP